MIIDAHCWGLTAKDVAFRLNEFSPEIIGIQLIFYRQVFGLSELYNEIKEKFPKLLKTVWVAGGHVPTFSPEEILKRFSFLNLVIRGEGEIAIIKVAETVSQNEILDSTWEADVPNAAYLKGSEFIVNGQARLISNLDSLPFPKFIQDDFMDDGPASLMGSRGCYATCEFCSVPVFFKEAAGPLWRLRSAENVFEEICILVKKYNIKKISFLDDIFLGTDTRSKKRAARIAELLIQSQFDIQFSIECRSDSVEYNLFEKLKSAGLARVFLGLEAGSEQVLSRYKKMSGVKENNNAIKILNDLEVDIGVGFIMFNPETTIEEFLENVTFLKNHGLLTYRAISNKMQAYPGTPVHNRLAKESRLFGEKLYPDYAFLSKDVEQLYQTIKQEFEVLDPLDIELLREEYSASNDSKRRMRLMLTKKAYSNDLFDTLNSVMKNNSDLKSMAVSEQVAQMKSKWENRIHAK